MPDDDRRLRARLQVDAARLDQVSSAPAVLSAMRPAMRAIRVRRIAVRGASLVLMVVGGAAAVQAIGRSSPDSIVVEGSTPVEQNGTSLVTAPVTTLALTESSRQHRTPVVLAESDDDGRESITTSVAPLSTLTGDSDEVEDPGLVPTSAPVPAATAPATTAPSNEREVTADEQTTPGGDESAPYDDMSTEDGTDDDTAEQPAPPSQTSDVVHADSRCGSVDVDMATSPPTIVSVVTASGYTYRLEDPEPHRVVVQFTGAGEDCEVKVPAGSDD